MNLADSFWFFKRSLQEKRRYRFYDGTIFYADSRRLRRVFSYSMRPRGSGGADFSEVTDSHRMNPGAAHATLRKFEERFRVRLPRGYARFIRRWNGGTLLLRGFFRLLPIEEVWRVCRKFRRLRNEAPSSPWRVIRFCDLCDGDYIGFVDVAGEWVVAWCDVEEDDEEILKSPGKNRIVLARTFTEWLRELLERDGLHENPNYNRWGRVERAAPSPKKTFQNTKSPRHGEETPFRNRPSGEGGGPKDPFFLGSL